jgi:pyruvate formate lyase activating enzyme
MIDKPLIVEIKRNALDDGPGIRTLIFFKGCPLSCVWCQNPEAKSPFREILFDKAYCTECGNCKEACQEIAIDFEYQYRINRRLCTLCGDCIDICPNDALKFVGKQYSVEELLDIILKDKIFYDNSGGGVTLSGGEPLYHIKYVHNLLKELKKYNINICIETSGFFNRSEFEDFILPFVDLIYFDLKIYDPKIHVRYCKVPNEKILENFQNLIQNVHIEILPRIPLIPGITDTDENLYSLANYLKSFKIKKIGLLPYNPLWLDKSEKLGIPSLYTHQQWLSKEEKKRIEKIFSDFQFKSF